MASRTIFQPAEVALKMFGPHGLVTVYHVYTDDDFDQGARTYWYSLYDNDTDDGGNSFDVREMPGAAAEWPPKYNDHAEHCLRLIARAIELGEITPAGSS